MGVLQSSPRECARTPLTLQLYQGPSARKPLAKHVVNMVQRNKPYYLQIQLTYHLTFQQDLEALLEVRSNQSSSTALQAHPARDHRYTLQGDHQHQFLLQMRTRPPSLDRQAF